MDANKKRYFAFSIAMVVMVAVLFASTFFAEGVVLFTIPSFFKPIEVTYTTLILLVVILAMVLSYKQVEPDEVGVLVFLGKPLFNIGSGPFLVWVIFSKLVYGPRKRLQEEFPADHSLVHYGEGEAPVGKVEPFRITTGGKAKLEEGDDPLEARLTLDVSFFTALRICDLSQFIKVIGFDKFLVKNKYIWYADEQEAFRQLQDTAKRFLNEEFAKRTPNKIIKDQGKIASKLASVLEGKVKDRAGKNDGEEPWGVDLQEVALTHVGLSHDLNKAMRDVPQALFEAQKAITAGTAEAKVFFLNGEQAAKVTKLKLVAEAEGLDHIAKKLGITDEKALNALINAKFTESALGAVGEGGGKLVIVGGSGGVQNLLGLLEANKGV